jgi:hypothetical protein
MDQGPMWNSLIKKTGGQKSHGTILLTLHVHTEHYEKNMNVY